MSIEIQAPYVCPTCFETNEVNVDPSAGAHQRFIEDCPVCCHPIQFLIVLDREGELIDVQAEDAT